MPRGRKKHLSIAIFAFADDDNQIQAACIASECAIHYSVASWQVQDFFRKKKETCGLLLKSGHAMEFECVATSK